MNTTETTELSKKELRRLKNREYYLKSKNKKIKDDFKITENKFQSLYLYALIGLTTCFLIMEQATFYVSIGSDFPHIRGCLGELLLIGMTIISAKTRHYLPRFLQIIVLIYILLAVSGKSIKTIHQNIATYNSSNKIQRTLEKERDTNKALLDSYFKSGYVGEVRKLRVSISNLNKQIKEEERTITKTYETFPLIIDLIFRLLLTISNVYMITYLAKNRLDIKRPEGILLH
jgi:hypothetical protein